MASPSTTDTPQSTPTIFIKRSSKSRSSIRKRPSTPPPAPDSDDSDYSSTEEAGDAGTARAPKKRRKNQSVVTTETTSNSISSVKPRDIKRTYTSTTNALTVANDATKTNWHNEGDDPSSSSRASNTPSSSSNDPPSISGKYSGSSAYGNFIKKSENAPTRHVGPMKAPSNIRTITITDYAPDVCKDYKQTGFCGFGDTCKFLHAREDYAQGWKLDRDWEINQKTGKARAKQEDVMDDEEKELKDIPFKCVICKSDYKTPIVTKCKHYFCESCALVRYKKSPSCAICGKRTDGAFNVAKELRKKLARKQEREEERRAKEEEEALAEGK